MMGEGRNTAHCDVRCKWNWCQSACRLQRIILASFLLIFKITHTQIFAIWFFYFSFFTFFVFASSPSQSSFLRPFAANHSPYALSAIRNAFGRNKNNRICTYAVRSTRMNCHTILLLGVCCLRSTRPFRLHCIHVLMANVYCISELRTMNSLEKMNRFRWRGIGCQLGRDTWKIVVELHLVEENIKIMGFHLHPAIHKRLCASIECLRWQTMSRNYQR